MGNFIFGAKGFKPFRAPSSGCNNRVVGKNFGVVISPAVLEPNALAFLVFKNKVIALIAKHHFNAVIKKVLFNGVINTLCLFGSHVANRAINKLKPRLNCFDSDFFFSKGIFKTFNMLVRAEFKIYFVRVINGFLRGLCADKSRKIAADLIAKRKLSVGKCTCAGKAGGDVAIRLAGNADLGFVLRAMSVFNSLTLFNNHNAFF